MVTNINGTKIALCSTYDKVFTLMNEFINMKFE